MGESELFIGYESLRLEESVFNEECGVTGATGESGATGATGEPGATEAGTGTVTDNIPSFIHYIFDKNQFNYDDKSIENTKNGIIIKHNNYSWPYKKPIAQMKLLELLGYVTSYAVRDTVLASKFPEANFCLWSDKSGLWHFRSLSTMFSGESKGTFVVNDEIPLFENKIHQLTTVKNHHDAVSQEFQKLFKASYKRIEPNFSDPYFSFVDTRSSLKDKKSETEIKYDYDESFKFIPQCPLDGTKLNIYITGATGTTGATGATGATANNDYSHTDIEFLDGNNTRYGYFSKNTFNVKNSPWWENIGSYSYSFDTDGVWQSQFDLSPLDFRTFYKIITQIKVPLQKSRRKFNKLMNLKRKWEVYRCKICCLKDAIGSEKDRTIFKEALELGSGPTFENIYGKMDYTIRY